VLNLTKALELIFKFKNNGDLSAILLLEDMIKEEISLQQAKVDFSNVAVDAVITGLQREGV